MLETSSGRQVRMVIESCVDGELRRGAQFEYLKMSMLSQSFDALAETVGQRYEKVDENE